MLSIIYSTTLKVAAAEIIFITVLQNGRVWFFTAVMHPKEADQMPNNKDTDQTAPFTFKNQSEKGTV